MHIRVVFTRLFLIASGISLCGCHEIMESIYKSINNSSTLSGPPHFTFTKGELHAGAVSAGEHYAGEVNADGYLFSSEKGGARFQSIELHLSEALPQFFNDIWVQIRYGEKTKLAMLTPQILNEHGYKETFFDDKKRGSSYSINNTGLYFEFNPNGVLTELRADAYCYPEIAVKNNPRMGSFSSGKSLALPCSLPELESVFGKPDKLYPSRPF